MKVSKTTVLVLILAVVMVFNYLLAMAMLQHSVNHIVTFIVVVLLIPTIASYATLAVLHKSK